MVIIRFVSKDFFPLKLRSFCEEISNRGMHLIRIIMILPNLHRSIPTNFILFYFIYLFIIFLAALGLRCYAQAFSSCSEWGLLFVAVRGLLTAVASLVAEHGLQAHGLQ